MKKFISILLSVIMIFSVTTIGFAVGDKEERSSIGACEGTVTKSTLSDGTVVYDGCKGHVDGDVDCTCCAMCNFDFDNNQPNPNIKDKLTGCVEYGMRDKELKKAVHVVDPDTGDYYYGKKMPVLGSDKTLVNPGEPGYNSAYDTYLGKLSYDNNNNIIFEQEACAYVCCDACKGTWPCDCGCECCQNKFDPEEDGGKGALLPEDYQNQFYALFHNVLQRIVKVFDMLFNAVRDFLKVGKVDPNLDKAFDYPYETSAMPKNP